MNEDYIPTYEQIEGLNKLLKFLRRDYMEWYNIKIMGGKLIIKSEPVKGEIDLRVFHITTNGDIKDDGFREYRL